MSGKDTPNESRVELKENLRAKPSFLSADDRTSNVIGKRGGLRTYPYFKTLLMSRHESGEVNM